MKKHNVSVSRIISGVGGIVIGVGLLLYSFGTVTKDVFRIITFTGATVVVVSLVIALIKKEF